MLDDNTRLKIAPSVTYQSLGEGAETVILSLADGQLYTCNETTASFLRAAGGGRSFGQVVDALEAEYEVGREQLRADLLELAERLLAEGILAVAEG